MLPLGVNVFQDDTQCQGVDPAFFILTTRNRGDAYTVSGCGFQDDTQCQGVDEIAIT